MGIDTRRSAPPLPAPTESSTLPADDLRDDLPGDEGTDLSRRTDRSSWSVPEDGSPITISTHPKASAHATTTASSSSHAHGQSRSISHTTQASQTSLLIEYFEGGKGPNVTSRPSVRVKVTPSAAKKGRQVTRDHVQISESVANGRKPSYTRRISLPARGESQLVDADTRPKTRFADTVDSEHHGLGHRDRSHDIDAHSLSSQADESNLSSRPPGVEVEVLPPHGNHSDLSGTHLSHESRYVPLNPSDISSMPPESLVEESLPHQHLKETAATSKRGHGSGEASLKTALGTAAAASAISAMDTLKTPSRRRSRSLSRERIAQKAVQKIRNDRDRERSSKHKHAHTLEGTTSKSRSRSVSKEQLSKDRSSKEQLAALDGSSRRRSSKHRRRSDEIIPSIEPSLLTASQVSDGRSFRSGTSKSSINNPKLLETVEDAIRRLILPELTALKAEQQTQQNLRRGQQDTALDDAEDQDLSTEGRRSGSKSSKSKHSSTSRKPKLVLSQTESETLPRKHRRRRESSEHDLYADSSSKHGLYSDSLSEHERDRGLSEETVVRNDRARTSRESSADRLIQTPVNRKDRNIRDSGSKDRSIRDSGDSTDRGLSGYKTAALGALASGVLTREALKHHDSQSSLERRERRRKRRTSTSRSQDARSSDQRTASVTEEETVEDIFHRHDVAPMPMRSEVTTSDVTRDSILSERTSTPTSERRRHEIRQVARASPRQITSPQSYASVQSPRSPLRESYTDLHEAETIPARSPNTTAMKNHQLHEPEAIDYHLQDSSPINRHLHDSDLVDHHLHGSNSMDHHLRASKASPAYAPDHFQDTQASFDTGDYRFDDPKALANSLHRRSYEAGPRVERDLPEDVHDDRARPTPERTQVRQQASAMTPTSPPQSSPYYDGQMELGYGQGRSLSPIQSVASFEIGDDGPGHEAVGRTDNSPGSLASLNQQRSAHASRQSFESVQSASLARSRPLGMSLESPSEVMTAHRSSTALPLAAGAVGASAVAAAYTQSSPRQHQHRDSVDAKRLTQLTDHSTDSHPLDAVTTAQQIRGIGARPDFVHAPDGVESAVASLHEPSVLASTQSGVSGPAGDSFNDSPLTSETQNESFASASPIRPRHGIAARRSGLSASVGHSAASSPRQSVDRSIDDGNRESFPPTMSAHAQPDLENPMPEIITAGTESKSDISTNPPAIQGPRHGPPLESSLEWPQSKGNSKEAIAHDNLKAAAANMLAAAGGAGAVAALVRQNRQAKEQRAQHKQRLIEQDDATAEALSPTFAKTSPVRQSPVKTTLDRDATHETGDGSRAFESPSMRARIPESPTMKDEGYATEEAHGRSAGALTPDYRQRDLPGSMDRQKDFPGALDSPGAAGALGGLLLGGTDDPFSGAPNASANSDGMPSPLYDSAMGRGMDRIQSKDIVALMDHLTVRDAQRNARDTEILCTLVRSAAEMRNSFEDMKKFIALQDDMVIDVGNKQHEKTQRVIGGPRPQPPGMPRTPRRTSEDDYIDDIPAKRRNVFRRALKGLSGRNTDDLARIENMLNHLLDEVAGLKSGPDDLRTGSAARITSTAAPGLSSYEQLRNNHADMYDDGYEAEGRAGTASTPDQLSPGGRSGGQPLAYSRRHTSGNRVSTVMEEHEDDLKDLQDEDGGEADFYDDPDDVNDDGQLTPTRERMMRGSSVPVGTPPRMHIPTGAHSNEHTPQIGSEKGHRRNKTSSSSFFPKISRWSKTTASSMAENVRNTVTGIAGGSHSAPNSGRKERPYSGLSQSNSGDLGEYDLQAHYDPAGDDRLRSDGSLAQNGTHLQLEDYDGPRPPSPLIPSHVSEKPQYSAHRDSMNLQHPQPRQGHTARHQHHLEEQVSHDIGPSPVSLRTSDHFGSNPALARYSGGATHGLGIGGAGLGRGSDSAVARGGDATPARSSGVLSPESDDDRSVTPSASGQPSSQRREYLGHQSNTAHGSAAPPRPPKIADDGPLIPPKVPLSQDPAASSFAARVSEQGTRVASGSYPTRKPTGPRPITSSGSYARSPDRIASGGSAGHG